MKQNHRKYKMGADKFEKFFKENFQAASLIAFRYISDPSIIEDIVQESFIILWEKQSKIYRSEDELRKYLLVTVRNKTISHLRSIKIKHIDIESSFNDIDAPNDVKLYDDEELSIKISKAVEKLPQKCREIFLLAYTGNHTYQDIADRLSISKNTVKTQMSIAYRILREELQEIYLGFLFFFSKKRSW